MTDSTAQEQRQRVAHLFYEGEVHIWEEDLENDAQLYIHLVDGPHDFGDDLGSYLAWLLGPGRASNPAGGQNRMVKRLRIVVDDLEPNEEVPERREVEGHPNLELATLIKSTAAAFRVATPSQLAMLRDDWRKAYRDRMAEARSAYFQAAAFELLAAQAEREKPNS